MPRIVNRKQKKAEIAHMAMDVFAKKGFEKATIQEIAGEAGIGKGTIYQYFKTKEDILTEVSRNMFSEFERTLGAALLRSTDPVEKLTSIVETILSVAPGYESSFTIYLELWRIGLSSDRYRDFMKLYEDFFTNIRNVITDIIEDGKRKGIFRTDIDSDALAVSFFASLDGIYLYSMLFPDSFDLAAIVEEFRKNNIEGLKT